MHRFRLAGAGAAVMRFDFGDTVQPDLLECGRAIEAGAGRGGFLPAGRFGRIGPFLPDAIRNDALGRKFRIGHVNAVCMEQPIPHALALTKFRLRQFRGIGHAGRIDLDRALADFSFMPVLAEHILHKSSDVACHV
jgi:hypothetical protein